MAALPPSIYQYILQHTKRGQIIVIGLTLALLPLAPVPLELQRRILDEAIANKDSALLMQLAMLYVGALLLAAGIKFLMKLKREYIGARLVHSLRSSLYHCICLLYTSPSPRD